MQERVELVMDSTTKKWLLAFARDNFWRVADHIEFEDLLQDGFVIFYRVRNKYREQGRTHKHIINTFKLSVRNHLHDLATQRTRCPYEFQDDPDKYISLSPRMLPHQLVELAILQAPFRVRETLAVLASESGRRKLRKPYRIRGDGSRETLNERLCRIAGFDATRVDLATTLKSYFLTD